MRPCTPCADAEPTWATSDARTGATVNVDHAQDRGSIIRFESVRHVSHVSLSAVSHAGKQA